MSEEDKKIEKKKKEKKEKKEKRISYLSSGLPVDLDEEEKREMYDDDVAFQEMLY